MNALLETVDRMGGHVASVAPFLPDYPFKNYVVLLVGASVSVGVIRTLWILSSQLRRPPDPTKRLAKAEELAKAGEFEAAKEQFIALNVLGRAAQMAYRLKEMDEATSLALRAGEFLQAAQWLGAAGKHEDAAAAFEKAGRLPEAADQWYAADQIERALGIYRRVGNVLKSEMILERLKRFEELGEMYARETDRLRAQLGVNPPPKLVEQVEQFAEKAGNAYRRAKKFDKATQVFLGAGLRFRAAQILEESGDLVRASDLYAQSEHREDAARVLILAGKFDLAADIYEELGQLDRVAELLEKAGRVEEAKIFSGRVELQQGNRLKAAELLAEGREFREAAQIFFEHQQYSRAAECWEAAKDWENAAQSYEEAGDPAHAATMYVQLDRPEKAGKAFEAAGMIKEAITEFDKASLFFEAGRLSESIGATDEAISFHQRVPPASPDHWKSLHSLARLFWRKGHHQMAKENFTKLCAKQTVTRDRVELFYDYAVFLEGLGDLQKAADIYKSILAIDFHYKDVLARKDGLDRRVRASTSPAAPKAKPPDSSRATIAGDAPKLMYEPQTGMVMANRYDLVREIGRGAMGVIFSAKDRKLGRTVALKFLPPHLTGGAAGAPAERFRREAQVAAQLSHRGIVQLFDVGDHQGQFFIVMEFVDGPNALQLLEKNGALPPAEVARMGIQVSEALAYAHERRVVHRDIKSANLLVAPDGTLKITDFGLARMLREKEVLATQTLGSPLYMAPEQILGNQFDHRVDLYALGIVLFELLTGKPPFTEGEVTYHHLHTKPPSPRKLRPETPPDLEAAILCLLEKDPRLRFPTAKEVREALSTV